MCCNTAHCAFEAIQSSVSIPCIDLIDITSSVVASLNVPTVHVLASAGCVKTGMYTTYLAKFSDAITVVYPNSVQQTHITQGICNTKNQYRFAALDDPERPYRIFITVLGELVSAGAQAIVLGCTDIGVDLLPAWYEALPSVRSVHQKSYTTLAQMQMLREGVHTTPIVDQEYYEQPFYLVDSMMVLYEYCVRLFA